MTGGSLGMAFRASSLCFQSPSSVVYFWSVGSKNAGSSCAMLLEPMITSSGFVGRSSLTFRNIFHQDPFLNEIKNLLRFSSSLESVQ